MEADLAAYLIADVLEVTDSDKMGSQAKAAKATLEKHGAKILVTGSCEALEGSWQPGRLFGSQFHDMDKLKSWYNSPEYQELIKQRQSVSRANLIAVDGL